MNLDELQSVQARERQSSDLQHLRSSFYREVGEFIRELTEERARLVEQADDPFSSSEVRQLSDDIETAEQTVEAIYERRVGKVVKKASIAAAGMPVDDDGLTDEEAELFDDLVARIERNREGVLSAMDGDGPSVSCSIDGSAETEPGEPSPAPASDPDPEDPGGVSAADLMGEGPPESATAGDATPEKPSPPEPPAERPRTDSGDEADTEPAGPDGPEPAGPPAASADAGGTSDEPAGESTTGPPESAGGEAAGSGALEQERSTDRSTGSEMPGMTRTTVRITADVGEVVGADDRDYDLGTEDVVTLPEPNADVLVDKDAAERLE